MHTHTSKVAENVSQEEEREPVVRFMRSQNALASASSLLSIASKQNAAAGGKGQVCQNTSHKRRSSKESRQRGNQNVKPAPQLQVSRLDGVSRDMKSCKMCVWFAPVLSGKSWSGSSARQSRCYFATCAAEKGNTFWTPTPLNLLPFKTKMFD